VPPTPDQQSRAEAIAAEITAILADVPYALPGTLATRKAQCGRENCRCHASPPQLHGPYHKWTRKEKGTTVTRILGDGQHADYAPWFASRQRIRQLLAELEQLSISITENDPRRSRPRKRRTRKTP
jgi:hypothetical protein